ncbi:HEAT repeat-containing protein [Treponema bryantii]|uniref:HEAT repeat-containing protein n=1 Tax=Treponema bryantii TaxID=163 RepID=A0A1I3K3F2_9SPIR|nr:HEAT repeat domain-containing protein [Treponema bryantii]SFI66840.1 HEAT repeat-containing protein [Treponema bryantii]
MRKVVLFLLILASVNFCFAQEEDSEKETQSISASKGGISEVPASKRPKAIDKEKAEKAAEKDESEKDYENKSNTIKYGVPSEISTLIDELIKNDDPRFTEEIYDVFQVTKNTVIKQKVLNYFKQLEDPCLEDYAVETLNDPYEEKNDLVKACFQYISAVKTKEAIPAVLALIESENESYFNDAIATIGEIGGPEEAMFLVEYLEREDLSDAQRQTLMRTCGKMHAVQTWDKVVEVAEDEDENLYVRMYAAESLGLMEKKESVPILVELFSENDPNLRQYVIKGLSHFPGVVEAEETIMQGIRDEHWRVRQESIKTAKEMKLKDGVPYLIYRAKNDSEKVIKDEAYTTLAALNTDEANDFLIAQLQEKKLGDATKKKIVEVLLKEGHAGEKEILELADECLKDDKRKDLRYAIGKELAKYENSAYDEICIKYLSSKDSTTQSLGLDMYKTNKFSSAVSVMRTIYADKKANTSVKNRIKTMLSIEDEEEFKNEKSNGDADAK